ncbi:MAG: DMT family transporter [Limosilactobacillus sp.]|jgi:drug/metabolite transporter (DMT)-like permease|uniref:DMT family transporter n=1 Tax=Limosilactobacillus sp. TaxID=2773925 RepID=UPI0025C688CE|nr:DMT family transporter [Limosilactobacillus sp.]MCI1975477.1 DMT family transporter [Limosilactobacillus sp.]MCI2031357.1 DMT family transporter [Limosilactobacillus sp.]
MAKQMKGILLAAGGASLWGGSGAAAQYLFSQTGINTTWLVAVRLLLAGLFLTIISLIKVPMQVRQIVKSRRYLSWLIAFAVFGMLNSQLTYFLAVNYSNAPTATVLQYLQPVIIIVWLAFSKRQWPRRIDCISILIALVGTFLLVTGGHLGTLALTPRAIFWGIWCAVAAALYTLLPRTLLTKFDSLAVCGLAMLLGGICMLPEIIVSAVPSLSVNDWILVAYIVVFGTMLSYTMFLQSMRYITPSATGILSAFEPLVATLLAVTLLGTKLTGAAIVGSLLILLTTLLQSVPANYFQRILTHNFLLAIKRKNK